MKNMKTTTIAYLILCAVCVLHALYYSSLLPEHVAIHFNSAGHPDAWGNKIQLITIYFISVGVIAVLCLGFALFAHKVPVSLLNLPNKDYWLAPERKQETFEYISVRILWIGLLTILLFIAMNHQVFRVNLGEIATLDYFWTMIGVYFFLTLVWTIKFFWKFSR